MRYLKDDALRVASLFLSLSMAMVVIGQDKEHIQKGAFKIKQPYLTLLETMRAEATNERRQLRKTMEDKEIKVVSLHKNESFSSFLFFCQEREEQSNNYSSYIRHM